MKPQVAHRASDARNDRGERLRRRFGAADPVNPDENAELRLELEDWETELREAGQPGAGEAVRRIKLLSEVWECLASEGSEAADEVAEFCTRALDRLAAARFEEDGLAVVSWVVGESNDRWGEYLGILDSGGSSAPSGPAEAGPVGADEPLVSDEAAIDPTTLIRMLIGTGAPTASILDPGPAAAAAGRSGSSSALDVAEPEANVPVGVDEPEDFPSPPAHVELDPELREAFLAEAADLFERIETLVLALDPQRPQTDTLHELGRCFHTLKGAAGSVGLIELATLVHSLEERLEDASTLPPGALIDLFHGGLRYLEGVLQALQGRPAVARAPARPSPVPSPQPATKVSDPVVLTARDERPEPETAPAAGSAAAEGPLRVPSARIDELMDLVSELITRRGLWSVQAAAMKEFAAQAKTCRNRLSASIDRFHDTGLARESNDAGAGPPHPETDVPWLVRRLAEQAEDLAVLSQTAQAATIVMADHRDALDRLTLHLWDALQAIRIMPVRGLFQRLARVAHDAARVEGRQVEIKMTGEENGLDRAIQDKAFEPMLHMVRNAVGHGIEPSSDRVKAGKPAAGRVTLSARREGNTLVLSVADDGRGLDYAAIEAKGRRLGLLAPDERPTINRLNGLVFHSGFSTRDEANAISGRGVGMDVVAQEVARLHGTIDLASQTGAGTQVTLRLPVRLALERMMIVRVDGQAFALPVASVEQAQPFDSSVQEGSGPGTTVRIRDRSVPLVNARDALGLGATPPASNPKLLSIRTVEGGLALMVDAIEGTRELVLKPLGPLLAGHPVISGTGLSPTGEVILALNPSGISRRLHIGAVPISAARPESRQAPVLVVDDSISVRRVITRNLHALGLEVDEVSNGMEALTRLRSHAYSLVLTDLEMPHLDGFELLSELGRTRMLDGLPVVATSTKCDPETRGRVLALGARALLSKPVGPDELGRVLLPLLGRPSGAQAASNGSRVPEAGA